MVVRVRVRIARESSSKSVEVAVLVNSGAESEEPVVVVYPEVAEALGFSISEFDLIEVELATGKTHNLISRERVRVELLDERGVPLASTRAYLAVDENLTEPLMTDATIDELGIQVISFKRGLWRHVSDPPGVVRESVAREERG